LAIKLPGKNKSGKDMSKEKIEEKDIKNSKKKGKEDQNISATDNTSDDNVQEEQEVADNEEVKEEEIDPIEKLQDELAEAKDKFLRLYSEYDNFRRRTAKEKLELMQTANEDLMVTLLPVLDDFERAGTSFSDETNIKEIKEGVNLISQKFMNVLQQKGLKQMDTKKGAEFDADLHEAITQIPAPKAKLKGKIVDTIEKGYYLGEKVVRHARVVIGN
jgi:molecular chaperone GrpE